MGPLARLALGLVPLNPSDIPATGASQTSGQFPGLSVIEAFILVHRVGNKKLQIELRISTHFKANTTELKCRGGRTFQVHLRCESFLFLLFVFLPQSRV